MPANHEELHQRVSALFKALSQPQRLKLIHCLADGPHRVRDLTQHVSLAQSTVSSHLIKLKEQGLVVSTTRGRETWYELSDLRVDELLHAAESVYEPPVSKR